MSILVLTGLELEARTLAHGLGLTPVSGTPWPRYRHGCLEVACVGLSGAHVGGRGLACSGVQLVLSVGLCGALSPGLAEGQLVVPEVLVTANGERVDMHRVPGLVAAGSLLSAGRLIESPADKARLWIETGAEAVDMESVAIVDWAHTAGLPAAVVRAVSDTASQVVPRELAGAIAADGTLRTSRAVRATLGRPAMIGRALALRRGTALALAAVARALAAVARSSGT